MLVLLDFSPIRPEFGLLLWSTIIFILFYLVLGKFAFKPIVNALKKREHDIQDALDESKKAREEVANMKSENAALLAQAREERSKMLQEAKDIKNKMISEAKDKAKEEANKIVTNAKIEIENQKKAALLEVKNQVGVIAIEIAEKLLNKELSNNANHKSFVDQLVDDIKLN
ncbi:MAG: F0F1 ATP synthase subunit B [Saprospiraceae bacterium]|nr:F0F1 ATP synthase subunit B [Saprospiraceae bacterium]